MSPTRIALARVLRAWLDWPGVAVEDRFVEAETLRYVGDAIISANLAIPTGSGEPTCDARTLLAELDAHEASERAGGGVPALEPEAVPPSIALWHHVCASCADGREHKPIGGLSRDGSCAECGVAICIPHSSYLVSAAKSAAPGGAP